MIGLLGGDEPLPVEPDTRQRWVEKWLLLAMEEKAARGKPEEGPREGNLSGPELIRALGAVEVKPDGN